MAQKITKEEVEHVAKLARIEITEQEKEQFTNELSKVLEYVDKLQEVDTENVKPTYHPAAPKGHDVLENSVREDTVIPCNDREKILDRAPAREGDFVKVKSVF
jgi:aspartyl-tRNA(Asn)/glutamyl-tRNA(Gln) amidotransferase subunit C